MSESLGVGFKELSRYLSLDLDRHSEFHPQNNPEKFERLLAILRSIGLRSAVMIRSSWSEGLHVYYPFSKPISSFGVACAVKWTLFDHGILLRDGQIEIFPNAKSYGANGKIVNYKCLRLPLQPGSGSFLLDGMLSPYSDEVADLLSEFNAALAQQDLKLLKPVMDASGERQALSRGFGQRGNRASKWRSHLENRKNTGWTGFSQTNSLIKDMATYGRVFIGLSGKKLIEHTVQSATSAPGYERFCRHQPEIWRRAEDWCKCVEAYYWPYGSDPSRSGTYAEHFNRDYDNDCPRPENNVVEFARSDKRSTQAQDRIKQAIAYLSAQGTLPATATARSHAMIATAKQLTGIGISQTTLHKPKYLSLWHPDHDKPQASSGVIDCPERVSANSEQPEVANTPELATQPETLEPLPIKDCGENYTSCPIYEGLLNACPASAAPQAQADAPVLEQLNGGSGGDATVVENAATDCKINDCNPDKTKVVEISTTFHNVNDDAQPTDAGVSARRSSQPVASQNLGAALTEPAPQIQEQQGECEGGEALAATRVEQGENLQAESGTPSVTTTDPLLKVAFLFLVAALGSFLDKAGHPNPPQTICSATPTSGGLAGEATRTANTPSQRGCQLLSVENVTLASLKQDPFERPKATAPVAFAGEVTTEHAEDASVVPAPAVGAGASTAAVAPDVPSRAPVDFRRIAGIRVKAVPYAEKVVRIQEQLESRKFSRSERERRISIAKMRFLWESGEPTLMREATEWAQANPDALPEALPLDGLAGAGVAAAAQDQHADTADTNNADTNADRESQTPAEEVELEAYYLEAPNPADFECPCEDSQPDRDTYKETDYLDDYLEEIPDPPDSEPAYNHEHCASELELEAYYLDYLQAPNPADFEPPYD